MSADLCYFSRQPLPLPRPLPSLPTAKSVVADRKRKHSSKTLNDKGYVVSECSWNHGDDGCDGHWLVDEIIKGGKGYKINPSLYDEFLSPSAFDSWGFFEPTIEERQSILVLALNNLKVIQIFTDSKNKDVIEMRKIISTIDRRPL